MFIVLVAMCAVVAAILCAPRAREPDEDVATTDEGDPAQVADGWWNTLDERVGDMREYRRDADVASAACELVVRYRDEETCLVRSAGYLDLTGDAWGCVMEGPGWVDVCVVFGRDGGSVVRCVRMEAKRWGEDYG